MTDDERNRLRKFLVEWNPKLVLGKEITVTFRPKFKTIHELKQYAISKRNVSKRTSSITHSGADANKIQVKKLRREKLQPVTPSRPDSTKNSLEINSKSIQTRSSVSSKSSQVSQFVTKSQNTQTSLDSTSKSTQVSPSFQSESTQTAENQWSEIFAVQGENAKLKYQLLFNICNTLTEKLERQAKEIEKLERQAEKFAAHSEKISKLESEVQTLRTAQTLN